MKKKYILIILFSLFIISVLIWSYFYFLKKDKEVTFWKNIIKTTSYLDEEKKEISASISNDKIENEEEINKIYSLSRAICSAYSDYSLAVKSRYFTMLKTQVNKVKDFPETDTFNFLYIIVPGIIYDSCTTQDPEFNEKIVFYIQSENDVNNANLDSVLKEELKTYIEQIAFVDMETVDKAKLKSDKEYFDDYFFKKNEEEFVSVYYPYYIKEGTNLSNFLNKPVNTLSEEVEFKNKIMTTLLLNIKLLWFNDVEEFKNIMKSNYWINDLENYKQSLINDYKSIESELLKQSIDLKANLENLNQYKKFIQSWEYNVLFENSNINKMIRDVWKKMTILTALWNDYADGINETWSWKQFFGDEINGNNLIRLYYIYILKLNSDWIN